MVRNSLLLKSAVFIIFAIVIGTPLFYWTGSVYPFSLPRTAYFQSLVEILFFLWLVLLVQKPEYRPRFTALNISLLIFGGTFLLASFAGIDTWRSLWSTQERAVGAVFLLHGIGFSFVLASLRDQLPWRKLFTVSLLSASLVSIIAFLELGTPSLLGWNSEGRPGSTFGNPSIMASYLLLNALIAGWLFWRERLRKNPNAYAFAAMFLIIFSGVLVSQTRGAIAGFGAATVFLLLYFIFYPVPELPRKWLIAVFLAGLAFSALFAFTRNNQIWSRFPVLNRFQSSSAAAMDLSARKNAAEAAVRSFKLKVLTGWGPENFNAVFNKFYDPALLKKNNYAETRMDKPHNFFLEYMATGGILLVLSFLGLAFFLFRKLWALRRKNGYETAGPFLMAAGLAYLVQNFFLFDTAGTLMMLFLIIAYAESSDLGPLPLQKRSAPPTLGAGPAAALAFIPGLISAYFMNITILQASYYQNKGLISLAVRPAQAVEYLEKAIGIPEPYRWIVAREYASALADAYFQGLNVSLELLRKNISRMEEVANKHPQDAMNWNMLANIYDQTYDTDTGYLDKAEQASAKALELSPQRQEFYFVLAKTKTLQRNYTDAIAIMKKAVDLNPNVPDSHFYYGIVAFAGKKPEIGREEVLAAARMGRKWQNAAEERIAGNYFAEAGFVQDAINIYEHALSLDPRDFEAKLKLGMLYFKTGDRTRAREEISGAMALANIRENPLYAELAKIIPALGLKLPNR